MNCFDWQKNGSEYVDGLLSPTLRGPMDEHLKSCAHCKKQVEHYRTLTTQISELPRVTLPVSLRKDPFTRSALHGFAEIESLDSSRRNHSPWYVRGGFEALFVSIFILTGLWLAPKIKGIYDDKLQRRLQVLDVGDLSKDVNSDSDSPPAGISAESENARTQQKVIVGDNEIWRFNFKTESPRELEKQIIQKLTQLEVSKPDPKGIQAPGGIQIDFLVDRAAVLKLRDDFIELSNRTSKSSAAKLSGSQVFAWYRNRSRKPIPAGKTRVVIWLSQV